jgi:hypothetical protein
LPDELVGLITLHIAPYQLTMSLFGEIIESNNAFIPIAVGPHGKFGTLFRRFIEGTDPIPITSFPPNRPNAK